MLDPRMLTAEVCVLDARGREVGKWKEGTKAAQVLSELQQELGLFPEEGKLMVKGAQVGSDDELRLEEGMVYLFNSTAGKCSAYDLCTMPLPHQYDHVPIRHSTGGVLMVKTVVEDTSLRVQVQRCQQQLPKQSHVYMQPSQEEHFEDATQEGALVQALVHLVFLSVNSMIKRFNRILQRPYKAFWCPVHNTITLSSSRRGSGSSRGSSSSHGSDSRCNSGSGSMSSSKTTSHSQVGWYDTAAAAAVAPDAGGSLPASVYQVYMDPFSLDMDIDQVKEALRDQGLAMHILEPKVSLRPDFCFRVSAREWHQEQQSLQATGVSGGISSRSFFASQQSTFNSTQSSTAAGPAHTQAAAAAAAAPSAGAASFPVAASAALSSAVAAAATSCAAISEDSKRTDKISLVVGQVKPASVMCRAFDIDKSEFLQRVAACDSDQDRKFFSIAARCNQQDKMALTVVNQATGHAFFTGARLFVITCYSVLWVGELEKVEEEEGADGKIGLAATVTLSEPIFGKDAGPDNATARGAYLWLADQTLAKPYQVRHIAKPGVTLAPTAEAATNQPGGTGGDDDHAYRDHGDQQQTHQQQHHQQQRARLPMQMLPQQPQHQQQPPSSHRQKLDKLPRLPYQYFTYQTLQLCCLIADTAEAQVFRGTCLGREAVIKTLSLHWRPAGGYIHEAVMYDLLHDLQLSGVLCRLLGHGEYYGLRYCMVFERAPGSPLSQLAEYSPSVQQAVVAAVANIHQQDVIHGDLHQDNIFVHLAPGAPPKVTIIDLGKARPADSAGERQEEMDDLKQMLGC